MAAPPLQNFIDKVSVVPTTWLNAVDALATTVFEQTATKPAARAALTDDVPLETNNGGTGFRTLALYMASWFPSLYQFINPQTNAEFLSGITPVNYNYLPGVIDRYGTNTTPGTTDMTAAVTAACTQSLQPNGSPVYGNSVYLTSSSISGLHTAPKVKCTGILTRSGVNFYLWPTGSQTNLLNVSTVGNDANDGLGANQSFLTIAAATGAHINYAAAFVTGGIPVVQMASGTWVLPNVTVPAGFQCANYLQFRGTPGVLPFIPPTVIDGTGAAARAFGFNMNGNNTVLFQDMVIQNFANAGSCFGLLGQEFTELLLNSNIQFVNVDNAVKLQQGRLYVGQACSITGGVVGITVISQVTYSVCTIDLGCTTTATAANKGNAAVGIYINGCSQAGVLIQENSTGHFDNSAVNNSAVGLDIVCSSRANCNFSALTNNATAAIRCREASSWNDNGTSALFSGNGTTVILEGGCGEFTRQGTWTIPRTQPLDAVFTPFTPGVGPIVAGTPFTAFTYTGAIDPVGFNTQLKKFMMKIVGTKSNGATPGTFNVTVNLDGSPIAGFNSSGTTAGDWRMDIECDAFSTNQQSFDSTFVQNNAPAPNPQFIQGSRTVTPTAGTITVVCTINGANDTVSFRKRQIWNEGGA